MNETTETTASADLAGQNEHVVMCFAVTNQDVIIPLREIEREVYEDDDLVLIKTEIAGEVEYPSHCETHHKIYFKEMWLNKEGEPDKKNVFMTRQDAVDWVSKSIRTKIARKQRELRELQQKLVAFNT